MENAFAPNGNPHPNFLAGGHKSPGGLGMNSVALINGNSDSGKGADDKGNHSVGQESLWRCFVHERIINHGAGKALVLFFAPFPSRWIRRQQEINRIPS